jgi:molybdate-binding protein
MLAITALTAVGASGAVAAGIAAFDAGDAGVVPTPLVAVTVKVYDVPVVSPVTTHDVVVVVQVFPPGLEVTV